MHTLIEGVVVRNSEPYCADTEIKVTVNNFKRKSKLIEELDSY